MDNAYQCQLEVWGSKITLIAPRVFTAGPEVKPSLILRSSAEERVLELEDDDQFQKSIEMFRKAIKTPGIRAKARMDPLKQGRCIYEIFRGRREYEIQNCSDRCE